jgi:hypothetical protein
VTARRLRVVQWATGNIGTRSLRAVIEHPRLELVGVHVHGEAKTGRDAGELCGLPPTGVKASRSLGQIAALKPDCVLYMPQGCNFDELCALLESGANVVTTRVELNNPAALDPAVRARLEDACRRGNSSIYGTGASPGFVTEALPIALTSLQRRLDHLLIEEFADLSSRNSPDLLFGVMGFGSAPRPEAEAGRAWYLKESFAPSLRLVAEALGLSFDAVDAHSETGKARRDLNIAAGTIAAGTVAAQRTTITCKRAGKPLMTFVANWYCSADVEPAWDLRPTGWHLRVDGDTPLDVVIGFPVAPEQWAAVSPGLTAHRAVNAIAALCAAAPGIRTTIDLPQVIADLSAEPKS